MDAAERAAQAASRGEDLARRAARTLELRARAALLEPRARRLAQIRQTVAANQLAELVAERHLDAVTLDAAVSGLERLRGPHRVIGMITHLAAIEERMPRKLRVEPGPPGGDASVRLEIGEPPRESTRSQRDSRHVPRDPGSQ